MLKFFSHLVSAIINPLMAPTFLFAILLYYFPNLEQINDPTSRLHAILHIFLSTFLFSSVLIFVLYKLKLISMVTLEKQKDRFIPQLFLSMVYSVITCVLWKWYGYSDGLTLSMLASTVIILSITFINRFWKISTHASGVSGVFSIVSILYLHHTPAGFGGLYLIISFLTLAVCLSRLYLKVHTPMQVIAGFLLGALSGLCLFFNK